MISKYSPRGIAPNCSHPLRAKNGSKTKARIKAALGDLKKPTHGKTLQQQYLAAR